MHVNKYFLLSDFNFNIKFIIETTITLILFERKHNMARGISKRTLATLVIQVWMVRYDQKPENYM